MSAISPADPLQQPLDRTRELPVHELSGLKLPEVEDVELSNGVGLTVLRMGLQSVSRLSLVWPAGNADLPVATTAAHLTDMLVEGTASFTGAETADLLDRSGAWFGSAASPHHTLVNLHCLNRTAPDVLPLLRSMIAEPLLPADVLKHTSARLASRRRIRQQQVEVVASELADRLYFGADNPLCRPVEPEGILAVSREELADVHRRLMLGTKPHAFLTGRVSPGLEAAVAEMLESLPFSNAGGDGLRPLVVPAVGSGPASGREDVKEMPGALQSAIKLVMPAIDRLHPDYDALQMAVMALGGYFGSRLMQSLREERGYTYGVSASLSAQPEGPTASIVCRVDPRNVRAAVDEIRRQISLMATQPLTSGELAAARRVLVSGFASIADHPFSTMDYYISAHRGGFPRDFYYRILGSASRVTPSDICRVAERYLLSAPQFLAVAGH